MGSAIRVKRLSENLPKVAPAHHVGNPPTSFKNPWPSANRPSPSPLSLLAMRFGFSEEKRNFVPVPETRDELVKIRKPDWGAAHTDRLRATWFGHASFLVETPVQGDAGRGVRIMLDPVFADQMGPWASLGPKRFSPLPCKLEEVPEVDLVLISHNHYDHLDVDVVKHLNAARKNKVHFFCGLNTKKWFISCGVPGDNVTELDWWDEVEVSVESVGTVKLVCTPAQHGSKRTPSDGNHSLWCSWIVQHSGAQEQKKLFFAGTNEQLDPKFARLD